MACSGVIKTPQMGISGTLLMSLRRRFVEKPDKWANDLAGKNLSGGQRQGHTIARALVGDLRYSFSMTLISPLTLPPQMQD